MCAPVSHRMDFSISKNCIHRISMRTTAIIISIQFQWSSPFHLHSCSRPSIDMNAALACQAHTSYKLLLLSIWATVCVRVDRRVFHVKYSYFHHLEIFSCVYRSQPIFLFVSCGMCKEWHRSAQCIPLSHHTFASFCQHIVRCRECGNSINWICQR